jgi:Sulfotransferase family
VSGDVATERGTPLGASSLLGKLPSEVFPVGERIRFISAGPARLSEPFYEESLQAIRQSGRPALELTFEELRSLVGDGVPRPRAVVLHTGRCGSTLLLRMLGHDRQVMNVSEPVPISRLHWYALHSAETAERLKATMLDVMVSFDRFARSRGQDVVLKLSSWQAVDAEWLVRAVPAAPFVFVHRPVEEVVASELALGPAWGDDFDVEAASHWAPLLAELPAGASKPEVYAAVWASEVRAVLGVDRDRLLAVSYADLVGSTEDVLAAVAAHTGVGRSWKGASALVELRYYAKAANPAVAFEPDGKHARPALGADEVERVRRLVGDLPGQLARLSLA